MTGVALPILLALLAQAADRGKGPDLVPSPERSQPGPFTSAPSAPGDKAFRQLFTLRALPQNPGRDPIVLKIPDQNPASKIVCGMVVIQADPKVDPKFVVRAPADSSVHKIRRIPPQACAD